MTSYGFLGGKVSAAEGHIIRGASKYVEEQCRARPLGCMQTQAGGDEAAHPDVARGRDARRHPADEELRGSIPQPICQMSTLSVIRTFSSNCSGAMYRGEPTRPCTVTCVCSTISDRPKSQILQLSSPSRMMLSVLRSRCTTSISCRYPKPSATCAAMVSFCPKPSC